MMPRTLKWILAAMLLLPLAAMARQDPLVDLEVPVIEGLSARQVGDAVRQALVGRRWIVSEAKGNRVEATQTARKHMAKIAVSWDTRTVRIAYVDSAELNFEQKNGQRFIHPTYNKWIGNLEKDLPIFMQRVKYGQ